MRAMAPRDDKPLSVTELTRRIKLLLEREVGAVWVAGEISNWRVAASGHAYFTLKDAQAQIDAVMWKGTLSRARFEPENGLEVLAQGQVTVYERQGRHQLVVSDMQPRGLGALQLQFERLKARLQAEGIFDPALKKPLPLLPRTIGIVTSPTGAAIRDMLNVIGRRFASVRIVLAPARVQGDGAAAEIAEGIRRLDAFGVDVMIVGRGGGSLEDLWPFNEEAVVRAVHGARTPVISAVGHETDFTLCDFAADLRAPTPSAAAELVVREQAALLERVTGARQRALRAVRRGADGARMRLDRAARHYLLQRPDELLRQARQEADSLRERLEGAMAGRVALLAQRRERAAHGLALQSPAQRLARMRERGTAAAALLFRRGEALTAAPRRDLGAAAGRLNALSPLGILERGYALAWRLPERELVREAAALSVSDRLELRFGTGTAEVSVEEVRPAPKGTEHSGPSGPGQD